MDSSTVFVCTFLSYAVVVATVVAAAKGESVLRIYELREGEEEEEEEEESFPAVVPVHHVTFKHLAVWLAVQTALFVFI
jgi:hypothetical protein